ncbi:MAG: HAD-IIA family hydrolase [Alterinioella nitratireducens]|uniref:HAD-IIA family hydrolase n=1 Tax=Alterinioella nitratireducens TaxID=2735915 RepID=UPI0040580329
MRDITADWAFARYEAIRPRAPAATFAASSRPAAHLGEVAEHVDAFILDAFGVLNRGETAIPGAIDRMRELRDQGKRLIVLTNAASYTKAEAVEKYARLGFDFSAEEVISSRDVAFALLPPLPDGTIWAAAAAPEDRFDDSPVPLRRVQDDPRLFDSAGGFVLLSSTGWADAENKRLIKALRHDSRPLIVANPDLVAPREDGLTLEPGHFAEAIAEATGLPPRFFGKPHRNAFDAALARLRGIPRSRIAMVGDTLHTDVLGGAAAGLKTVLITDHGLFRGRDVGPYITRSGIVPDWIVPTT